MSDGGRSSLSKAVEKAASEVTLARVAISKGCEPAEALETRISTGPQDALDEVNERNNRNPNNKPEALLFQIDKDSPLVRFQLSTDGKTLLPLAPEIIPYLAKEDGPQDLGASDKDERKRRNDLAKYGDTIHKAFKAAKFIQTTTKIPPSTIPSISRVLSPFGSDYMAITGSIVTLSVIGCLKKLYKGR